MNFITYLTFFFALVLSINGQSIDIGELKCLVCQATVDELLGSIATVDPNKKVDIVNFRLDGTGNAMSRTVPYVKSEVYLSDLMDSICDKMDDYVRAISKQSKQLTLLRIMTKDGKMNPNMSEVDVVQDGDLNKSLKYYCEGILGENEEEIIKLLVQSTEGLESKVCSQLTSLCNDFDDESETDKDEL